MSVFVCLYKTLDGAYGHECIKAPDEKTASEYFSITKRKKIKRPLEWERLRKVPERFL